ncbi:MAG: hypothetical protein V1721_04115, partial [Pseudomonadota bacterium]
ATEDNKMAALKLAFPPEKKAADVREALRRFSVSLRRATQDNLKAGFNPNQARVSRGDPDGGQWTGSGGGGGGGGSGGGGGGGGRGTPSGGRTPRTPSGNDNPMKPSRLQELLIRPLVEWHETYDFGRK